MTKWILLALLACGLTYTLTLADDDRTASLDGAIRVIELED